MQLRIGMLLTFLALGLTAAARADMELVAPSKLPTFET